MRPAIAILLIGAVAPPAIAQEPQGWRTDGTGVYPDADPVLEWSPTKNVVWAAKMPSWSNSQPVFAGERVFVCSEPDQLVCLDRDTGKILWQRSNSYRDAAGPDEWARVEPELEKAAGINRDRDAAQARLTAIQEKRRGGSSREIERESAALREQLADLDEKLKALPLAWKWRTLGTHREMTGYTTPTPATDGRHVWAVFGNAVVACYDLDGRRKWIHKLPDVPHDMFGHSISPLLIGDLVVVCIEHTTAFDADTGEQCWRTKYGQSWGSPIRVEIGGEDAIALANGRYLRAADGTILGRGPILADASPVLHAGRVYYVETRAVAVELPRKLAAGEKFTPTPLWEAELKGRRFYSSPIVAGGKVYNLSSNFILSVLDERTGKLLSTRRVNLGTGTSFSSLVLAGPYLLASSHDGTTAVLDTRDDLKPAARNRLERFISTPVFHGDRMYVRTQHHLFCIGRE